MMNQADMLNIARATAADLKIEPELIAAVIEQESNWNPWALRYEPAFFEHYIKPILDSTTISVTEAQARSFSWGLMQTMGQTVREMGFTGSMASLCDPTVGILWGCKVFNHKLAMAEGNVEKALLLYNGGGNPAYPGQVLARTEKYKV
jgi:soluble lytic murein transglycosylase-like protein